MSAAHSVMERLCAVLPNRRRCPARSGSGLPKETPGHDRRALHDHPHDDHGAPAAPELVELPTLKAVLADAAVPG
ncbi:hypothetical protein P3T39_003827 [Kitasatospora sp. GP82]|nr:hypothetical protein [Kitasatospora sp. GP82]